MFIDKVPQPQDVPENISALTDDMEKMFAMVRNAKIPEHLDVAEEFLRKLSLRWSLHTKNFTNPIYSAILYKIQERRNEFDLLDMASRDSIRVVEQE